MVITQVRVVRVLMLAALMIPACAPGEGGDMTDNGGDPTGGDGAATVPDGFPTAARASFDEADRLIVQGEIASGANEVVLFDIGALAIGDRLDVLCIAEGGSSLDPMIALFDGDGFRVFWNDDINPGTSNFDAAFDGFIRHDSNYFLAVTSTSFFSTTGRFRCTVTREPQVGVATLLGQTVVLDFQTNTNVMVSGINYGDVEAFDAATVDAGFSGQTAILMQRIVEIVQADFAPFNVTILTSDDDPPQGNHSTVFFGGSTALSIFGIADGVDFYNADDMDNAIVFLQAFGGLTSSLEGTAQAVANVVSHEIGHTLGLMHTNDVTTLMDTTGEDVTLLDDQSFGIASIVDFPIGRQDSPTLLEETVGRQPAAGSARVWRCGTCGAGLRGTEAFQITISP